MHMRYIESLLTLYDERNISKASQKLFISQQGLSRQIQTIEKELGTILFKRAKTGVVPTDLCIKLHPNFVQMYKSYTQAKDVIQHHSSNYKKPITIAFAYGISRGLNTEVILSFQQENPDVRFKFKEWSKKKCIDKLLANEADIAFLVNPFDITLFEAHLLAEGYMYIAIHKSHPLANQDTIDFSQLDRQTIITGSEDNALRELFDYYCRLSEIQPNIMFSSSYSLDIINSNTDKMLMATVTPIMSEKITNPNIKVLRLITPEPGNLFCCTSKNKKKSKDLICVVDFIKGYFSNIAIIKIQS
jgi:DNA-binding transcriptional LysR family regulator